MKSIWTWEAYRHDHEVVHQSVRAARTKFNRTDQAQLFMLFREDIRCGIECHVYKCRRTIVHRHVAIATLTESIHKTTNSC